MKTIVLAAAALSVGAQAQVYRCHEAGRTIYSDQPCQAATVLSPEMLRGNSAGVVRAPPPQATPAEPTSAPIRRACPDETMIHNLETYSIFLDPIEKQVRQEQVQRARACQPLMTPQEMSARVAELKEAARAARAARQAATPAMLVNCDPAGCWDTNGNRYNNAAGGNFTRSDGAFCTRQAGILDCH